MLDFTKFNKVIFLSLNNYGLSYEIEFNSEGTRDVIKFKIKFTVHLNL